MEKVKRVALTFIALFNFIMHHCFAQESVIARKGLLRTQLTLSPSYNLKSKLSGFYLHGNFEAYLENSVSVAGESYFYLGELNTDKQIFDFNHSLFFGASKHFIKQNHDVYFGLQPGISITKLRNDDSTKVTQMSGSNPLFSFIAGYNYFVSNYFHFFVQYRIVAGNHHYGKYQNLSEMRISAGLGLNINSIK